MSEPTFDDLLAIYSERVAQHCCRKCGGLIPNNPPELVDGLLHNVPFCFCAKGRPSMIERQMNYSREHGGPA